MFFAYILRDPETQKAFYVGKGQGNRPLAHIIEAKKTKHTYKPNKYKLNTIRKILNKGLEVIIQKIEAPSEQEAIEMEMLLIAMYGRRDIKTGILTNCTDGGDGTSGYKHTAEALRKMSECQKGKIFTEEHKANMRKPKSEEGRKAIALARLTTTYRPSTETKQKTSIALKGRPSPMRGRNHTEKAKLKMSQWRKGRPKAKIACPQCAKLIAVNTAKRWHFDNCKTQKEQYVD